MKYIINPSVPTGMNLTCNLLLGRQQGSEVSYMHEPTISFSLHDDKEKEIKQTLTIIYDALRQKGYNPINQIVGYILSEDPTYITTYNNARSLIRRIDRDELLQILVKSYLND